jgi:hypothetical protein
MDKADRADKNLTASAPLQPLPRPSETPPTTVVGAPRSPAAPIMLSAVAAALIVGGVLALSLALWPDDGARNELQQVDFRLHELSQTVLGSVLVLGGLVVFAVAAVLHCGKRS